MISLFDKFFEHKLEDPMFTATLDTHSENRKARLKNHNTPILQYIYHGDHTTPLHCLLTGEAGWLEVPNWVTKESRTRFRLDFNHVRQQSTQQRHSGHSLDKGSCDPSHMFRSYELDHYLHKKHLLEFLTCMPITTEQHSYVSQDSSKHDITLKCFPKDTWPWALQNAANWKAVMNRYSIKGITYTQWIDHLCNINYPGLHNRLCYDQSTAEFSLK